MICAASSWALILRVIVARLGCTCAVRSSPLRLLELRPRSWHLADGPLVRYCGLAHGISRWPATVGHPCHLARRRESNYK